MKKYLLFFFFPFLFACDSGNIESNPELEKLNAENKMLLEASERKDSSINAFMESFNIIEENLALIKETEKFISISDSRETQLSKEEQIVVDIQSINDLMSRNREMIEALNRNVKKAGLKITEFEKMIARLTKQLEEKDSEIASLKSELIKVNSALENLFAAYNNRVDELDQQTSDLNTAFYVFGTKKELQANGIITKEGGFIGIGRTEKLSTDFKKDYFTQLDITATPSISIFSQSAKLLTSHPSASYQFEGTGKVDQILITDPKEFWSVSKYLVVVVE